MFWFIAGLVATNVATGFALFCCLRIPRPLGPLHSRLAVLLACAFAVELYGTVTSLRYMNNTLVYNLYFCVEFVLLLGIIRTIGPPRKWPAWAVGAVGLGAMLADLLYTRDPHFLLTHGIVVIAFLLTVELMLCLWHLSEHSAVPLQRVPEFWLLLGLMCYFTAAVPLFSLLRYIVSSHQLLAFPLYRIVLVLSLVRYGLIGAACLLVRSGRRRPRRS